MSEKCKCGATIEPGKGHATTSLRTLSVETLCDECFAKYEIGRAEFVRAARVAEEAFGQHPETGVH